MTSDLAQRIRPCPANPWYWQYRGEPVLLIGGSVEDNLFQISDIEEHLDLLRACGGNYVRCTMSSRDPGDAWPFERDGKTGLYNLEKPGREYWRRFETFLRLCAERDIILQIEMWDRFDFARGPWQDNPYNPKNNSNYTVEESGLPEAIATHPGARESCFFRSVPALEDNKLLLAFQHAQVDELLERSLPHGNVLYCMDNETNESPEWGRYWARYIRQKASAAGVKVETTEMWDAHELTDQMHANTYGEPETYTFVDCSQNNHQSGQKHWDNLQAFRELIRATGMIRPMNCVKTYGANTGRYGTNRDGQERFWRSAFGGVAATRFHRPTSGLGLSPIAQAHIKSLRMCTDALGIFTCVPHLDLVDSRSPNEAYCTADPGRIYGMFFPDGGDVQLDVSAAGDGSLIVRWMDILKSGWLEPVSAQSAHGRLRLVTPRSDGYWAALISPAR
ncbi:hypothetical protein GX586_03385 [bacterium]|nr:hypothetical protein [bacterium]